MLHPGKLPMCQIWKLPRWQVQDGCLHGKKPCGMLLWPIDCPVAGQRKFQKHLHRCWKSVLCLVEIHFLWDRWTFVTDSTSEIDQRCISKECVT